MIKPSSDKNRPNILIICSDQHNPAVTGCYGNDMIDTPNIDRLAAEGITFDSAYCSFPLCVPSRMSFLTGLNPFRTHTIGNGSMLNSIVPTYANMAVGAGYHTVLSGRMHFVGQDQHHGFLERLVGEYVAYWLCGGKRAKIGEFSADLGNMSKPDPLTVVGPGHTYYLDYDHAVTEASGEWLNAYAKTDQTTPFLMTVGLITPHCPYIAPPELYSKYADRVKFEPMSEAESAALHPVHHDYIKQVCIDQVFVEDQHKAKIAYYALTDFLDSRIGEVLQSLEDNGLADNTIVIYISDHGDMIGEHGRWHKGCFFESSVRVPFIVKMPDKLRAGTRVKENISLVDLFPTVCEFTGAEITHPIDGSSLTGLINGTENNWKNIVRAEAYTPGNHRMVVRDKWKFNHYSNYPDRPELFNLETDPEELHNLAAEPQYRHIVEELRQLVYSDGWHDRILEEDDARYARYGYYNWMQKFRDFAGDDPLMREIPHYWKKAEEISCYLT